MGRYKKLLRREVGEILAEAGGPLFAGQIADRIGIRKNRRSLNYSVNIIASILRGAHGVETCYPSGARIGAARQYIMTNKKAFDEWVKT